MTRRTGLIVALDKHTLKENKKLIEELSGTVEFFKVGLTAYTAFGEALLKKIKAHKKKVFLDLKFHDIPNTVYGAVRAACSKGVDLLDVHASGGKQMIEAARRAIDEEGASRSTELLVVTVLTSMGESTLKEIGFTGTVIENVVRLANLAADAGADGVVASAQEVGAIKSSSEGKLKVICPGVRPVWARRKGDQKRVVTPEDAARSGADHIVVGRPIIDNADPQEAAFAIIRELERAQLS